MVLLLGIILGLIFKDIHIPQLWFYLGAVFFVLLIAAVFAVRKELTSIHKNVMDTFQYKPPRRKKTLKRLRPVPRIQGVFGNLMTIRELHIMGNSPFAGKSVLKSNVRERMGAMIIAIEREGKLIVSPGPQEIIGKGDTLFLVGSDTHPSQLELGPLPKGAQDRRFICALGETPPEF
jgi:di/tricarboxylate transporter